MKNTQILNHQYSDREDNLAHCKVCNGAEGSLTTHCPGNKMSPDTQESVFAGQIDFVSGQWVPGKCVSAFSKARYLVDQLNREFATA